MRCQARNVSALNVRPVDIEAAVPLAQIIERLSVLRPYRRPVLTVKRRYLSESSFPVHSCSAEPYVARDGRRVMFSPRVLISLFVVIEERPAVRTYTDILHRNRREHYRSAALSTHLVHLRKLRARESHILGVRHHCSPEEYMVVIPECYRHLIARVRCQPSRHPSVAAHYEHVHASLSVGCKSYALSVRAPHGMGIISSARSNLPCLTSSGVHGVDITFVSKSYLPSVRRNDTMPHP